MQLCSSCLILQYEPSAVGTLAFLLCCYCQWYADTSHPVPRKTTTRTAVNLPDIRSQGSLVINLSQDSGTLTKPCTNQRSETSAALSTWHPTLKALLKPFHHHCTQLCKKAILLALAKRSHTQQGSIVEGSLRCLSFFLSAAERSISNQIFSPASSWPPHISYAGTPCSLLVLALAPKAKGKTSLY